MAESSPSDELIAVLAHAWLSSMTVIIGSAHTLIDAHDRLTPKVRGELLEMLRTQSNHVSATLTDLVRSARPEVQAALDALTAEQHVREK